MASLGALGALGGAGQAVTGVGEAMRQRWLLAAEEAREDKRDQRQESRQLQSEARGERRLLDAETRRNTREDDLETRRNTREDEQGTVQHTRRLEEIEAQGRNRVGSGGGPGDTWSSGGNTYSTDLNGDTWMLDPDSQQWINVGAPGQSIAGGMSREELMLEAEDYADKKVSERAGWMSTDATDFKDHGGSRATAREAFIQEFLQGRGAAPPPPGATPPPPATPTPGLDEGAAPVSLNTPPVAAPAAAPRTQDTATATRTGGRSTREATMANLQRAKVAISNGASRDAVVQRLKENGYTDEEIQRYGI